MEPVLFLTLQAVLSEMNKHNVLTFMRPPNVNWRMVSTGLEMWLPVKTLSGLRH